MPTIKKPSLRSLGLEPSRPPAQEDEFQTLSSYMGEMAEKKMNRGEKLWFEILGPLTLEDLRAFNEVRANGKGKVPSAQIKTIRTIHHQIAQYMAQGLRNVEISAVLGVSQSRISLISNDPAFEELLEFYQDQQKTAGVSIIERLNTISTLALEEIQDRLLDSGDEVAMGHLLKLIETTLDRSGHSPGGNTKRDQAPGLARDDLARLKQQTQEENKTTVISRSEYIPKGEKDNGES